MTILTGNTNSVNRMPGGNGHGAVLSDCDLLMQAHQWGKEDALEGRSMRGSVYYPMFGAAYESYSEGFRQGLGVKVALEGNSSEGDFLLAALESLRSGKVKPVYTLTTEQLDAIDAEWIGQEFSTGGGF
jgi:hypothetical protein